MPSDAQHTVAPPPLTQSVPLHFKRHNFKAVCYDTVGCTVVYNGRYQIEDAPDKIAPPKPQGDYRKDWDAVELGIPNFPKPVQVTWKSKDGTSHEASIDLSKIFKDELIWHNLRKEQMTDFFEGPVAGAPDIYLEVDNRTINVYTAMFIPTKEEQIPGNRHSNFRKDIFLVWSQTY